jgi:hypothetical protein
MPLHWLGLDLVGLDCFQFLTVKLCGSYMDLENLAKRIRDACVEAVLQAYEDAGGTGPLC